MSGDLHTHMRKHTGDEPFKCRYANCNMRYKWRSSLSHHEGLHRKNNYTRRPRKKRHPTVDQISPALLESHLAAANADARARKLKLDVMKRREEALFADGAPLGAPQVQEAVGVGLGACEGAANVGAVVDAADIVHLNDLNDLSTC